MQSLSNKVHALSFVTPDQQEISKHRSEASQSPGFNTLKTGYWGTPPPVLTSGHLLSLSQSPSLTAVQTLG